MAYLAYKSAASKESAGQDCSNARHRLTVLRALFPDKAIRSQLRDNGPAFEDFEWAKVKRLLFVVVVGRQLCDGSPAAGTSLRWM